jgi:Ring finger domain
MDSAHNDSTDSEDSDVPSRDEDVIEIIDRNTREHDDQDDGDVILIPPDIETIDLCTHAVRSPRFEHNEVIDITESPAAVPTLRRSARNARDKVAPSNTRSRDAAKCDDRIAISCPICFDSVVPNNPVSTKCGHIFCKTCLNEALVRSHKCPMCMKKVL